jgi:hypothetical protein
VVPLVFLLGTCALLIGFFVMVGYEERVGRRFCTPVRDSLDKRVAQLVFIAAHVDFAAFVREEIRHLARRVGHAIVGSSLQVVRVIERALTRTVRSFRMRYVEHPAPRENAREFVKTLSDFKETLKATPPDISDIA